MNRRDILLGVAAALMAPAYAREEVSNAAALAGDRFRIHDDEFHLADIRAPSAYDLHRVSEPFFREATEMLADLLADCRLTVSDTGERDRWGARRVSSQCAGDDETVQERLVTAGAARVNPQTDDIAMIDRLLSAERAARQNRRGLWSLHDYRVFDAEDAGPAVGGFHLVEGVVVKAQAGRGRFYINFGADYREDFTATAPSRRGRAWARDGVVLKDLEGARIRVRGFVEWINGPSIELAHIKAIELLD